MNKIQYIAALAAVPCMVCHAEVQFTSQEKVQIVEMACAFGVMMAVEKDGLSLSERIEMVEGLTTALANAKRYGVSDDLLDSAIDILRDLDEDILRNFNHLFANRVEAWENNNYRGRPRLRNAVHKFVEVYVAD